MARRRQPGQTRIVEPDRDLRRQILEQVARQPELGEHDEAGTAPARLLDQLVVTCQIGIEHPEPGGQLGEGHGQGLHARSIAVHARVARLRERAMSDRRNDGN